MTLTEAPAPPKPEIDFPSSSLSMGWHLYLMAREMLRDAAPISNYPEPEVPNTFGPEYERYDQPGVLVTTPIKAFGNHGARVFNHFHVALYPHEGFLRHWSLCWSALLLPADADWQQALIPWEWHGTMGSHDTSSQMREAFQAAMERTAQKLIDDNQHDEPVNKIHLHWEFGGYKDKNVIPIRVTQVSIAGESAGSYYSGFIPRSR